MSDHVYSVLVIGAGPAGLSVGYRLRELGQTDFLIVDMGDSLRRRGRYDPVDSICGVGGAGLFSDGKFSFFPSATGLWESFTPESLREGSDFVASLTKILPADDPDGLPHGLPDDKRDEQTPTPSPTPSSENGWSLKQYPSVYLSLEDRIKMIDHLTDRIGPERFRLRTRVTDIIREDDIYRVTTDTDTDVAYRARTVVIAGGRMFSVKRLKTFCPEYTFMRLEYGVRLTTDHRNAYFATPCVDPKYKKAGPASGPGSGPIGIEYRTFCCCRRGETVCSDYAGIKTFSGRADCDPTDESNTGFNVRILDEKSAHDVAECLLTPGTDVFTGIPLSQVLRDGTHTKLRQCFGELGEQYLVQGLRSLVGRFPCLSEARCSGPTVEGIGSYIATDQHMKVPGHDVWVVSDACGKYRGLTGAMVSGYCVGACVSGVEPRTQKSIQPLSSSG